jgi:hypothetical protein
MKMQLCIRSISNQQVRIALSEDVSQISLLLPQITITSRNSATTPLSMQPWDLPHSIKDCLILQVSLDSNIYLCPTVQISHVDLLRCLLYSLSLGSPPSPPVLRHTSTSVTPSLQYAVQWVNGSCSLETKDAHHWK